MFKNVFDNCVGQLTFYNNVHFVCTMMLCMARVRGYAALA